MFNIGALILITILMLIDSKKTIKGIKRGLKKIKKNMPIFLNMIIIISISLYFISDEMILRVLASDFKLQNFSIGILLGSITFMPGFIVFPLAGLLVDKGIGYGTIAAFTTSLMLVGITTIQIEFEYYGKKFAIIRNLVGVFISIIISIVISIYYGGF